MAADTCRLCLRPVDKAKSVDLATDATKLLMLKEFLPEMNLDISENTQVCSNCIQELESSYNFKQGVVVNEAKIQTKLEENDTKKIDLKLMLDDAATKELKDDDFVCRTCIAICRTPSISLFDSPTNMMPYSFVKKMCQVVFELEFIASDKPVLCDDCWETLQTVYNFRKCCLRTDKKIRTYVAKKNIAKLTVDEFKKFVKENPPSNEDEDSTDDELDGFVKDEPIDEDELKFDPEEASCSSSSVKIKEETAVKSESELNSEDDMEDEPELLDPKAVKSEASELDGEDCKMEIGDVKVDADAEGSAGPSGKGKIHNYRQPHNYEKRLETVKGSLNTAFCADRIRRKGILELQNAALDSFCCAYCPFQTSRKSYLKQHMLIHQADDTVYMFLCTQCTYKTKHRRHINRHLLIHQTEDAAKIFSCPKCLYKGKQKQDVDRHMHNIHLSTDASEMFSCTHCSFKTSYKGNLRRHLLLHQSHDALQMFSCDLCSYKSTHQRYVKRHQITHQSDDAVPMFSCTQCAFKSKHKRNWIRHMRIHQLDNEIQIFSCTLCSYKTKFKDYLKRHNLTHFPRDSVEMFHCGECCYKTKYRNTLKQHISRHRKS